MGNVQATARLQRLMDLGFSAAEARQALEQTNNDVDRAAELLLARRARESQSVLVRSINRLLRTQRPWSEFFERFMWPEHLEELVHLLPQRSRERKLEHIDAVLVDAVDIATAVDDLPHRFFIALTHCTHEWAHTLAIGNVRVGASVQ